MRRSKNLSESLVFAEEISAIASVVARKYDRSPDRPTEFIAVEWRYATAAQFDVIEIIAGIERRIAKELERAAVNRICPRACHNIGVAGSSMADLRKHHAGI